MPPKKSIETLRNDQAAADREADILHLIEYVPALVIGPFFWALKCLITIATSTIITNVFEVFCTAPLNTFITLQLTSAYIFLFMWGWILIGPTPCKKTKPIFIMYGVYIFIQFVFGILGTVWYSSGKSECSQSAPELTNLTLFEVVTFWLSYIFGGMYICIWQYGKHKKKKQLASGYNSSSKEGDVAEEDISEDGSNMEEEEEVAVEEKKVDSAGSGEDTDESGDPFS